MLATRLLLLGDMGFLKKYCMCLNSDLLVRYVFVCFFASEHKNLLVLTTINNVLLEVVFTSNNEFE